MILHCSRCGNAMVSVPISFAVAFLDPDGSRRLASSALGCSAGWCDDCDQLAIERPQAAA